MLRTRSIAHAPCRDSAWVAVGGLPYRYQQSLDSRIEESGYSGWSSPRIGIGRVSARSRSSTVREFMRLSWAKPRAEQLATDYSLTYCRKMKTKFLILAASLSALIAPTACAQAQNQGVTIQTLWNKMSVKILTGDVQSGVQYVLPRLVELIGGPDKAMAMMKKNVTDRGKEMGMKITCLEPTQFAQVGTRSFALIPTINVTTGVKDGRKGELRLEGSSLAVSADMGVTWHFLDLHGDEPIPEELIPGGIGSIKPPAKKSGVFKAH